jgi:hypothetical protein
MKKINKEDASEGKKPVKHDLSKNPDKYKVRTFDPDYYERVLKVFPNGTTGWVERKRK